MTAPDLTPTEVAEELRLSRWTVLGYLRMGTLPGYQVTPNGPWRIPPELLAEWKQKRSSAPRVSDPNRIEPRSPRSQAARNRKPKP